MSTPVAIILLCVALAVVFSVSLLALNRAPSRPSDADVTADVSDGVESELLRRPLRSRQNA